MIRASLSARSLLLLALAAATLAAGGCARTRPLRPPPAIAPEHNALEQRAYQTRTFDGTEEQTLRVVIATLQDLGFVIDQASPALGVVSGTRLGRQAAMRISVTVRPHGAAQVQVRANAQHPRGQPVEGWRYQEFFTALGKALYLKTNEVD